MLMSRYYKQSLAQTLAGLVFSFVAIMTIGMWLPIAMNLYMGVATLLIGLLPW